MISLLRFLLARVFKLSFKPVRVVHNIECQEAQRRELSR